MVHVAAVKPIAAGELQASKIQVLVPFLVQGQALCILRSRLHPAFCKRLQTRQLFAILRRAQYGRS